MERWRKIYGEIVVGQGPSCKNFQQKGLMNMQLEVKMSNTKILIEYMLAGYLLLLLSKIGSLSTFLINQIIGFPLIS